MTVRRDTTPAALPVASSVYPPTIQSARAVRPTVPAELPAKIAARAPTWTRDSLANASVCGEAQHARQNCQPATRRILRVATTVPAFPAQAPEVAAAPPGSTAPSASRTSMSARPRRQFANMPAPVATSLAPTAATAWLDGRGKTALRMLTNANSPTLASMVAPV
uniref:Uncharacterized protein n=1 Tax=Macrostomum lignano TaxID=282301 RepID=A0A1I8JM58_9PLAT